MTEKELPQNSPNEYISGWTGELVEILEDKDTNEALDINAISEFTNIISYPERGNEWSDTYPINYTVEKLIEVSNISKDEDINTLVRRWKSIEELTNIYSLLLKGKSELAETVVDSMIEKLKSNKMILPHGYMPDDSKEWIQTEESSSLLEFFYEVSKYPTENKDITKKALEALIETWDIGDYSAPKEKTQIILNFFKMPSSRYIAGSEENEDNEKSLNRELLLLYLNKTKEIKKDSPRLLEEILSINSSLLSLEGKEHEDNVKRYHMFQNAAYLLENETNPLVRRVQVYTLDDIMKIEDKKKTGWEGDHLNLTKDTFLLFSEILTNEIVNNKVEIEKETLQFYKSIYESLGYIFSKIYEGDNKWKEFFTDYNSEIINTFNNYVKVIETPTNPLSQDSYITQSIYETLDSILPLRDIASEGQKLSKDPFLSKVANIKGRLYIRET